MGLLGFRRFMRFRGACLLVGLLACFFLCWSKMSSCVCDRLGLAHGIWHMIHEI